MRCIIKSPEITIYQGLAEQWDGDETIDLVFTNPYGYLPESLVLHPMVIHQWVHRHGDAQRWAHNPLSHLVGTWNNDREAFWSAHLLPICVDVREFKPEPGGWYPEAMVRRLIESFAVPGQTVWDGFMGRGTVGKICCEMGIKYVGVEELPKHVELALDYLELR